MKIRLHRGGLDESMRTMEEIDPTFDAVRAYLTRREVYGYTPSSKVQVVEYADNRPDTRIGWARTCLILLNGHPCGMTDELIQGEA